MSSAGTSFARSGMQSSQVVLLTQWKHFSMGGHCPVHLPRGFRVTAVAEK